MKRVAVVGAPGTGKSTLARYLADALNLPVIHLDFYHHQKTYDYPNNKEMWIDTVRELIAQDTWIIDGNYGSTFKERFERADLIIFLDYPRSLYLHGILKRRFQYRNKSRVDMPSDWKEKNDIVFIKYVWHFRTRERHKITNALEGHYNKKVKIFLSRKDAADYIKTL
jgi:adenylate kinase family enzyme